MKKQTRRDFLNWIVNNKGISQDNWVTRLEIGTEIADNTKGTLSIKNLTFEINGESRSPEFYDPSTGIHEHSRDMTLQKADGVLFPSGTSVEIINMQGARIMRKKIPSSVSPAAFGRTLPGGVYLMYRVNDQGIRSKNAIVVPVM